MTGGKVKATILFSPAPSGEGDFVLVDRLEANGHTFIDDDESSDLPILPRGMPSSKATVGEQPESSAIYEVPLLSYRSTDHDDMLISSIGTTVTAELGQVSVPETGSPYRKGRFALPLSSSPMRNLLI